LYNYTAFFWKIDDLYSLQGKVSVHDNHRLVLYHNNGSLWYNNHTIDIINEVIWTVYLLARNECSIRVTVLLEYLNLALDAHSWVSIHSSRSFIQILLYYCNELFQLSAWYAWKLIDLNQLYNCDQGWVWFHILVAFNLTHFKPQNVLPRWLLHIHTLIPASG